MAIDDGIPHVRSQLLEDIGVVDIPKIETLQDLRAARDALNEIINGLGEFIAAREAQFPELRKPS